MRLRLTDSTRRLHLPPEPLSDELAMIPGPEANQALRVRCMNGGELRLEKLAYGSGIGWYVQKSFCIPTGMLAALIPELRKADCLTRTAPAMPRFRDMDGPVFLTGSPSEPRKRGA